MTVQDNPNRGAAVANAHRAKGRGKCIPAPVAKILDVSAVRFAGEAAVEDSSGFVNNVLGVTEEDSTPVHTHVQTVKLGPIHSAPNVEEPG